MSWNCPKCNSVFEFHNGPPSSGGPLAPFTNESAERMWQDKSCCFLAWWRPGDLGGFGEF